MTKDTVILIEPSFYGINFVKEAKELGCKIIVVVSSSANPKQYGYSELYDDLLICDIRKADQIIKAIENSEYKEFSTIIPGTDYVLAITAKVREHFNMKGMSYEAYHAARNKDVAREVFKKSHVPSAKFAVVSDSHSALKEAHKIGYPLVIKPTNTASSQGVFFVENGSALENIFIELMKFKETYLGFSVRNEFLLEEFVDGNEYSVEIFLVDNEVLFSEVTEKHTTPLPFFVEISHIFPATLSKKDRNTIIKVAVNATKSIGITNGPAHVEVKLSKEGPKIIEVNARPGGDNISTDLIENALGINFCKQAVLNYLGRRTCFNRSKELTSAIGFITASEDGELYSITGIDELGKNPDIVKFGMKEIPKKVFKPRSSDDRLGYFILTTEDGVEAKKKLKEVFDLIKFNYR